jgi:NAD(P)-dependent dehydrogenase (short-subunit alcohol dehydrogenase family)
MSGLVKSLARELEKHCINVNSISGGAVLSDAEWRLLATDASNTTNGFSTISTGSAALSDGHRQPRDSCCHLHGRT